MPPQMLDKPPMQPPDLAAQQNQPAFAGVGQKMAADASQGGPGFANAIIGTVEKALQGLVRQSPTFAPFVARAVAILKAGLEQSAGAPPSGPAGPGAGAAGEPPAPSPEGGMKGFPG